MHETQPPPLAGIKIVDLTRYLAGPFCTQILGDYGAEILKIEPVENPRGELGDSGDPKHHDSYFFLSTNRSKKSIRLAIKKPEGREILMRLIDAADVVVDNFRPGVMQAIGLDYETLPNATRASSRARSRASARPGRCEIFPASIKSRRGCRV